MMDFYLLKMKVKVPIECQFLIGTFVDIEIFLKILNILDPDFFSEFSGQKQRSQTLESLEVSSQQIFPSKKQLMVSTFWSVDSLLKFFLRQNKLCGNLHETCQLLQSFHHRYLALIHEMAFKQTQSRIITTVKHTVMTKS